MTDTDILLVNPGADVYGSDLQMLESVRGFTEAGHRVLVVVPSEGPLVAMLEGAGAVVQHTDFPVLRRTDQSARGLARLAWDVLRAMPRMHRVLRDAQPRVVYVNTVTIPWWSMVARMRRVRTVSHVHEAEAHDRLHARLALYLPLLFAHRVAMISDAALRSAVRTVPLIRRRSVIVRNGVPDRPSAPEHVQRGAADAFRIGVVARLSPRKGTMDALEVAAALLAEGRPVTLELYGSCFPGYEWYESDLRRRAALPDLRGAVTFHGYTRPVWPALDGVDALLAPSMVEPFGNSVVEAQLSLRPVVASTAEGHQESVVDGESGILVDIGDVTGMATAIAALMDDPDYARRLAAAARERAKARNDVRRYHHDILALALDG